MTTIHGDPTPEQRSLIERLHKDAMGVYDNWRVLEDGTICCTCRLATTTAILIGVDEHSWEHRFCYPGAKLALLALACLEKADSEPLLGYVASRHAPGARITLKFTPRYTDPETGLLKPPEAPRGCGGR